jgi:hypothetical protein
VRHSIIGSSKNIADEFSKKYLESNNSAQRWTNSLIFVYLIDVRFFC